MFSFKVSCIQCYCPVIYTKTVCTSVGSTNVKLLCWVVILLLEKNKQKLDVSSEGPSSRVSSLFIYSSSQAFVNHTVLNPLRNQSSLGRASVTLFLFKLLYSIYIWNKSVSNFTLNFRLELDIEPFFASMALYDGRVKKKVRQLKTDLQYIKTSIDLSVKQNMHRITWDIIQKPGR
jgi:hypothetical protein